MLVKSMNGHGKMESGRKKFMYIATMIYGKTTEAFLMILMILTALEVVEALADLAEDPLAVAVQAGKKPAFFVFILILQYDKIERCTENFRIIKT